MSIILLEPEQLPTAKTRKPRAVITYYDTIYNSLIYLTTKATFPISISIITPHKIMQKILLQ